MRNVAGKSWLAVALVLGLAGGVAERCEAQVVISEFVAKNDDTLIDGDGNYSDWLELHNSGTNAVDLTGWYLSDETNDLQKWSFPATNIAAGGFLVVFASGQDVEDYVDSLGYLHTTFKLSGDGESVVLTRADGVTVEDEIVDYPVQSDDVAYGIPWDSTYTTLVAADEDAKALVPTSDAASTNWHYVGYNETGWLTGHQGVGYEASSGYESLIGLDVQSMRFQNGSVYIRIAFDVSDADAIGALSLRTKYDDGFTAFLNGTQIATANAPDPLAWNSMATASHDADLNAYVDFDASDHVGALQDGTNILAIQGVNVPLHSSDMLVIAELNAAVAGSMQSNTLSYLSAATPGRANVAGFLGYVEDTKFTVDRGFYTNAFEVAISCDTTNAAIYYTVDATSPATNNGTLYTGPITIGTTTVLRAAAFVDGYQPSDVDTQTYIFLSDIVTQAADASPLEPDWPSGPVNGQVFDYAMDPDVVNDPDYADLIDDALLDIPSVSIVTDPDNLFDAASGIYVNALDDGALWERETSVELINPDGTQGFQINGGVRIRGGMSRQARNPKHSFRLFFRSEYGTARLNYDLFGDEGADSYKRIDLRTGQNFSWHLGNSGAVSTWLYDIFVRDAHREMGQPYTRGRFYHLYLNGQYWGLYQTEERPDARYGESYYGDDSDDYDIVKAGDNRGQIEATDGVIDDYQSLWSAANSGVVANVDYFFIQGMNADGSRNESYTQLLDVDNLADYMLTVFYVGNRDSPLGPPNTGSIPNNLFALYNRVSPEGFKFIAHDAEHALGYHLTEGVDYDIVSTRSATVAASSTLGTMECFNPWWLHLQLVDNDEYKLRFADRVHRHLFNDGVLTPDNAVALLNDRKTEMELAIIAESARWGDYITATPRTRDDDWLPAVNSILDDYLQASPNTRRDVVVGQLESVGWYPAVDAPSFSQHGGSLTSGYALVISGDSQIYYTTDGSDPRAVGGSVAGAAYSNAVTLTRSTQVKARVLSGGTWSALTEAIFVLSEVSPLRVTEVMYHPIDPVSGAETNYAASGFEFIELLNTGTGTVGLAGTAFSEGVRFDFTDGDVTTLDPGEYVVLVNDLDAFAARYTNWANINIAGEYYGQFYIQDAALANSGEQVALIDGLGRTILDFEYDDWYAITDGDGYSLTLIDPAADTNAWNESTAWRPSKYVGGTPGSGPFAFLDPDDLVINEVLTHQDQDDPGDWIELFNNSTNTIDINGWYLSDDDTNLTKVVLSGIAAIAPGGYQVLTEHDHFGAAAAGVNGFALSELGEGVYLSSSEGGELTGYRVEAVFGAAERDVTFGRHIKSDGTADFTAQSSQTSGASNAYPLVDSVVITEFVYHPADSNGFEFVEICNRSASNAPLYDLANPTNTWKLEGAVTFSFPTGIVLSAGECLLVTETNEAAFRSYYTVDAGVTVLGPYEGALNNDGEDLTLTRPGEPEALTGEVPYIVVELVDYNDAAPWPLAADGLGSSLARVDVAAYPNDATNWVADASPSPGSAEQVLDDHDGDGMPDSWEIDYFGNTNAVDGGADEDWDEDGATNYDEWRAGTDPTDAESVFALTDVGQTSGCVFSWLSATGKFYSLWISTNLVSGEFTLTNSAIPATPPVNVYTTGICDAKSVFYRLSIDDD